MIEILLLQCQYKYSISISDFWLVTNYNGKNTLNRYLFFATY